MTVTPHRRQARTRRAVNPTFQAPMLLSSPTEPNRPTEHKGVAIVGERVQNLPNAPFRSTRIRLADGTVALGCRDCVTTTDTRAEMLVHRNQKHGEEHGLKPAKIPALPASKSIDLVLQPREDGPAPDYLRDMTLGEVLALAPSLRAVGHLVDKLEAERDEARQQATLQRLDKATQHKLDTYDKMQQELGELRTWKKRIVERMRRVGFSLQEDGQ